MNQSLRIGRLYLIPAITAIFAGGLIYVSFRKTEPGFFSWFNPTGIGAAIAEMRLYTIPFSSSLPEWFIYSLPEGLWAFSYSLLMVVIWWNNPHTIKYLWLISIPVLILGFEFSQLAGFIRGTFCAYDLLFGMAGIIIGFLLGHKFLKGRTAHNKY